MADAPDPAGATSQSQYTLSEAVDAVGFGRFQVAMLCYAGMAWLSDAMEMMLLSYLGPAVACQWSLSPREEGLISTVVFIGTLVGANAFGALSDSCGRRIGFFATAVFSSVFGLASALAPNYAWLLFLRSLVGVGLGGAHVPVALYMEFVPMRLRGVMLVALQSFWTLGTMFEALLGWAVLSSLGWRWLLALSSIPLCGLTLLYPVIPESPFWLAAAGRTDEARGVLERVARVNRTSLPPGTLRPDSAPRDSKQRSRWESARALLSQSLRSLTSIFTGVLGVTTGLLMFIWFANALTYYGEVLLTVTIHTQSTKTCGSDGALRLSSRDMADVFVTSAAELPGLIVAALLIDVLGRRRTMVLGLAIIAVSTGSLLVSSALSTLKLFVARAASMGAFTVLFIYTPEVYPTRVRSFALGLNNSMSRVGAILAPSLAVDLGRSGHLGIAEGVITALCAVAAALACLLPYETAGRTLQAESEDLKKTSSGADQLAASSEDAEEPDAGLLGEREGRQSSHQPDSGYEVRPDARS